ncbi:mitogen-activated protein kinase kinase kinase 18-like [Prosopis cineraria]|uniref:mitogen-activated protein kinase kinase kinase 18-like n=1 Tax=Prosopis cineraria TaxID=364024 RepID=UPI00240F5A3A|nr:mitogen-activated protein kinase kinase kinase 18-like [Prosopis cineraria]
MVNMSSLRDSDSSMASWVRGSCIGKGSCGTVTIGVSKSDGRVFAVKSVDLQSGQVVALENEIRILRSLSSPYVVTVLGDDATTSYRNLYLEYLPGGTLADLASPKNGGRPADVDERVLRYFTWCVVNALRYVHSRGVVHCDVKGRNVLVGLNGGVAKLADFGSAVEQCSSGAVAVGIVPRGSPLWMAPEVIRRESQGPESDVWSLGCTVIEMLTGKPGWDEEGFNTLSRIGYSDELPEFPSQLSELGRDFLRRCLRREPSERWSCDQLLHHPFLLSTPPNKLAESSPRCILDLINSDEFKEEDEEEIRIHNENSANDRIRKLATKSRANWEMEDDWLEVRALASNTETSIASSTTISGRGSGRGHEDDEGTSSKYVDLRRVEEGIELGISWEYLKMRRTNLRIGNWVEDHSENDWRYEYGLKHEGGLLRKIRAITICSLWCYCWCDFILKINFLLQMNLHIKYITLSYPHSLSIFIVIYYKGKIFQMIILY